MSSLRTLLHTGVLVAPLSLAGCPKNKANEPVAPVQGEPVAVAEPIDDVTATRTAAQEMQTVKVRASIEGIDDMLIAAQQIAKAVGDENEETPDPMAELQAGLLQSGFGPGFLGNIDMAGMHLLDLAVPTNPAAGPEDADVAASVATIDARKVIESMPAAFRPQPLGDGVYELRQDQTRMLMKDAGKELRLGLTPEDLERAATLRGDAKAGGPRIQARATDIPTDQLDPVELLDLPAGLPLTRKLGEVLQELQAVSLDADFGTKRNLEVVVGAEAPFSKLGIEPLGQPRAVATKLEQSLPDAPFFVTTMSFGDPAMVHKMMDKSIPMDQIPAPFQDVLGGAIQGAHGLLDQIADDVALAVYVGKRGESTLVLAANVKDGAAAETELRKIEGAIVALLEAHAAMQGKNDAAKFKVDFKPDALSLGKVKADRLDVGVPKDFQGEFDEADLFLDKNQIRMVSFAQDGTAVLAIGAGARQVAGDVAKSLGKERKASLARNVGLSTLRESMDGCQLCVALDLPEYLRFRLLLLQRTSEDKAVLKETKARLAQLSKVGDLPDFGTGLRIQADRAAGGFVIPETLLFADGAALSTLRDISDFVDSPQMVMERDKAKKEAAAAAGKPKKPAKK